MRSQLGARKGKNSGLGIPRLPELVLGKGWAFQEKGAAQAGGQGLVWTEQKGLGPKATQTPCASKPKSQCPVQSQCHGLWLPWWSSGRNLDLRWTLSL